MTVSESGGGKSIALVSMLRIHVPLQIILPCEASVCTTERIATSNVATIETVAVMLGFMSNEVFLKRESGFLSST